MVIVTTIRREVLTLPAAELGPDNPLPPLRPLDRLHRVDDPDGLPRDMARQTGYAPLHSLLPVRVRDGYERVREPRAIDTLLIENDRLCVTVLPGLGGRIASLRHKPTDRELLYRNPVFQPAAFALNGAWFSGGIERAARLAGGAGRRGGGPAGGGAAPGGCRRRVRRLAAVRRHRTR